VGLVGAGALLVCLGGPGTHTPAACPAAATPPCPEGRFDADVDAEIPEPANRQYPQTMAALGHWVGGPQVARYLEGLQGHMGMAVAFPNPLSFARLTWTCQRVRLQAMSGTLPLMDVVWTWYSRRPQCTMPEGYRRCLCRQEVPETLAHLAQCPLYPDPELERVVYRYLRPEAARVPPGEHVDSSPVRRLERALQTPGIRAVVLAGVMPVALVAPLRAATHDPGRAARELLIHGNRLLVERMDLRRELIREHLRAQPLGDATRTASVHAHLDMLFYKGVPHTPRVPEGDPWAYPMLPPPGGRRRR
jgi:hypothetical protein